MTFDSEKRLLANRIGISDRDTGILMGIEMLYVLFFRLEGEKQEYVYGREELLLKNWNLINHTVLSEDELRLCHLCSYFPSWSNPSVFKNYLEHYRGFHRDIRLFHFIVKDGLIIGLEKNEILADRETVYLEILNETPEKNKREYLELSNSHELHIKLDGYDQDGERNVGLSLPENLPLRKNTEEQPHEKMSLSFTNEDILYAAREMDRKSGQCYREKVVREGGVFDRTNNPVTEIMIDGTVNLLGQVSSGKSVLADCLGYLIAEKNGKTVYLVSSFAEAVNKVQAFRNVGVNAVVVASANEGSARDRLRRKILDEQEPVSDILADETLSFCALSSFVESPRHDLIHPGKEPCFRIYDGTDSYRCPFFGMCPVTKLHTEYRQANVLVTTPAGFCNMRVGMDREYLFEFCLDHADLIVADESDRLLNQFDSILTYSFRIREFIEKTAEFYSRYCHMPPKDQENEINIEFFDILHALGTCNKIGNRRNRSNLGFPESILNEFSSRSLFRLVQGGKVTFHPEDSREILDYIDGKLQNLSWNKGADEKVLNPDRYRNLTEEEFEKLNRQACFIQETVMLERAVYRLEDFAFRNPYFDRELVKAMGFVNREMVSKLPAPFINGVLRIQYSKEQISVHRQFAQGRTLLQVFPLLRYESGNKPCGPNVLMMSGTGYCPGSYIYHIPENPTYLLRSSEKSQEFLKKSKFYFPKDRVRVSGTKKEEKQIKLEEAVVDAFPLFEKTLREGRNILCVVNSYEQARIAGEVLIRHFTQDEICYVVRSDSVIDTDVKLNSGEIESFRGRILVVPTVIVERGHNIVDTWSNAVFSTLMILVRPMNDPSDLTLLNSVLSGKMIQEYFETDQYLTVDKLHDVRKAAYGVSNELVRKDYKSLDMLPECYRNDIYVRLFVTIVQVFGRLCRAANPERIEHMPEVYFLDGAFNQKDEGYQKWLVQYLEDLMADTEYGFLAEALYGPFLEACRNGELR